MELNINSGEAANAKVLQISEERYIELMALTTQIFQNTIGERPLMLIFSKVAKICNTLEEYTAMIVYAMMELQQKGGLSIRQPGEAYN